MNAIEFQTHYNNKKFNGFISNYFIKKTLKLNQRIARLLAVAVANHPLINKFKTHEYSKNSIDTAERLAELPESKEKYKELFRVNYLADTIVFPIQRDDAIYARLARDVSHPEAHSALQNACFCASTIFQNPKKQFYLRTITDTLKPQQLIENKHKTSNVTALAQSIYQEKAFDRMPILADALQDAEYEDQEILTKLRDINYYWFRGCYVLDAILNKIP